MTDNGHRSGAARLVNDVHVVTTDMFCKEYYIGITEFTADSSDVCESDAARLVITGVL